MLAFAFLLLYVLQDAERIRLPTVFRINISTSFSIFQAGTDVDAETVSQVARRPRTLSHRFIGSVKQDLAEGVIVDLVGDLAGAPHLSLHLLLQPRVNL